jgi:S-adenosylmethionine:tRNA ribosyltransferase-isomerase
VHTTEEDASASLDPDRSRNAALSDSPDQDLDDDLNSYLDQYDFELPPERIAQQPSERRDASRLLVLNRAKVADGGACEHAAFGELADWLEPGDLLVVNTTRVLSARLRGRRESGGAIEALLLGALLGALPAPSGTPPANRFRAMLRLSGRLRAGIRMSFGAGETQLPAEIISVGERGEVVLEFEPGADPYSVGEPPLPPYIRRPDAGQALADRGRYQTIYARVPGAVAAPTAGLHFSESVFQRLEARGIERAELVLQVGAGTFRPLDAAALQNERLHSEHYELPEATAQAIARTRKRGGRVIAVGTTSARVLETCANHLTGHVEAGTGETDIFLKPGCKFSVVDALVTNFHLPRSSLLLLVAAFAGRDSILAAYREAIAAEYRFYSYGDAMLIL